VGAGAAGQRATRLSRRRGRSPRTRPSRARDSRAQEDTTAAAGRAIRSSALLRRGKAGTEPGRPGDGDGDECPAWRRRDWCSQNREAVTSAGRWIDELELPPPPLTWSPDPGRANGIPQSRVETRARAGREMNYRPGVHPGCPALAAAAAPGRLVGDRSVAYMPPSTAQRMQALRLGTLLDRASMTVPARESICQQWHYARHDTWWKASPCTASAYAKAMDSLCTHAIRKSKKTLPRYEFPSITKGNKFKL
jgi:hypothetical protein